MRGRALALAALGVLVVAALLAATAGGGAPGGDAAGSAGDADVEEAAEGPASADAAGEGAGAEGSEAAGEAEPADEGRYAIRYDVRLVPTRRIATVELRLRDPERQMRWIRFHLSPGRQFDFAGDGTLEREGEHLRWTPPEGGGTLRYAFRIDQLKDEATYEARCAENWAIFRGDDLVPPARVRTAKGAESQVTLRLRVPERWKVAMPYPEVGSHVYRVEHSHRRFDRPTGWMAAGRLRILREEVAGVRLAIAGPRGQDLRRQDILAFLRWTLPTLRDALGAHLPERILIVGAGDPMWRGGLSGPRSLFLHAARPLVSSDGTSPVLHELFHTATHARAGEGGDWIVEGLAEYYSLEILRRAGGVSEPRHARAIEAFAEEGAGVDRLDVPKAGSKVRARAIEIFRDLDAALREATGGERSLDDLVARAAAERGELTPARLTGLLHELAGRDLAGPYRGLVERTAARAEAAR